MSSGDTAVKEQELSNEFLREVIKACLVQPNWQELKQIILAKLKIASDAINLHVDESVCEQVLLDFVGHDIRVVWGRQREYQPEFLQEVRLRSPLSIQHNIITF